MAVDAAPRQHQIETVALVQVVGGAQAVHGTVGAQVQTQVRAAGGPYLQAAAEHPALRAAARLQFRAQPYGPRDDDG